MSDRTIISFDYAIKHILRDKANFDILSGFLSELMERKVTVFDLLESESNKGDDEAKVNRVDLKAKIDNGEIAIFEIQCYRQADFFGKVLYGVSRAVTEQISVGGEYDIKKVYSISIAYYDLGAKSDYIFLAKMAGFKGLHTEELIRFARPAPPADATADIHPEYYLILPKMFDENIQNKFDEWIYTLKTSKVKSEFTASGIQEAGVKLATLKMEPAERKAYERFMEVKANEESILNTYKRDGIAEGIAEGTRKKAIEIARKMKANGKDENEIAEFTDLSAEEIRGL
ncbi:MAG: Rpn family recombination-promoting nuclease/putative transposase [Chitinispirillales bacterium]|nr:Rpn family recombination-promoting nuclease/putative transposase [Chitinispirillales bacterium]